jgi:ADP-heptose:LPS heptosyltransferase
MKAILKKVLLRLGVRNISDFGRAWRRAYFLLVDSAGSFLLAPHRLYSGRWRSTSPDHVRRILVIRIDRIGDLVLSTPAIRAVKMTYPEAGLDLLIADSTRDLIVDNPYIDRTLIYGEDKLEDDYDIALALHPGFRQNRLTYLSGAPVRIGYTGSGGGFYLTHRQKDDRAVRIRHEVESALEIAALAGCASDDRSLMISTTSEGDEAAGDFFRREGIEGIAIAIHPGARQDYIRWNKERFAAVADALIREDGVTVLLTGSTGEQGLLDEVVDLMEEEPVVASGFPLTVLVSLIDRCQLFLGNSTGPMHVAAALQVPVVAVFGAVHPLDSHHEWGPWGEGHLVVTQEDACADGHSRECGPYDCMNRITVEDVLAAVRRQLERIR